MNETDNGKESYSLGLDINQMLQDAQKAQDAFHAIAEKAIIEGDRIDKAFHSIGKTTPVEVPQIDKPLHDVADKVVNEGKKIDKALHDVGQSSSQVRKVDDAMQTTGNKVVSETKKVNTAFKSMSSNITSESSKIDKTLRTIGAGFAGYFTVSALKDFGKAVINARGEIESFQISFDTLIGNKDKAAAFFAELKDFAVKTPLLLNDLAKGGQLLLGFGVDLDKVMPTLKQIGDISMGNADRFNSLTLAFAQMSATGKLMGQDLLQMVNAGFNPLKTMSETTGKSMETLKDEMSKGAISADMVAKAFEDATATGGKFNGMLEKQSKGIKGSISNLEGAIQDALNDMGEKGQGIITEGISLATSAVQNYEKLGTILAGMIATYGMYKVAVILATEAEKGYTIAQTLNYRALLLAEKAQKLLNATMLANPYVLAAVALGAIVTAAWAFHDSTTAGERAQARFNEKQREAAEAEDKRRQEVDRLVSSSRDAALSDVQRGQSLAALRKEYPKIFAQYDIETIKLADILKLKQQINAEDNLRARVKEKTDFVLLEKEIEKYEGIVKANREGNGGYVKKLQELRAVRDAMLEKRGENISEQFLTGMKNVNTDELQHYIDVLNKKISNLGDNAKVKMKLPIDVKGTLSDEAIYDVKTIRSLIESVSTTRNKKLNPEKVEMYGEAYNKAKTEWETAKKQLEEIEKDKDKFSKKQYEAATTRKETAKKAYEKLGGKTEKALKKEETEAQKKQREANELKVEQAERQQKIDEYDKERANKEKQSEFDIRQARIDGLKEGFEKEKEQIDLNYDRLIEANRLRQEQWVKELQDNEREKWINENPNYKKEGKIFTPSSTVADLSAGQQNQLKEYTNVANEYQKTANDKLLKDLFDKYKNYEQRRTDINKKYDAERKAIENGKTADGKDVSQELKDAALIELEKKRKEATKAVNDEEVAAMQKSSDLLVKLFEDASNKSVSEINKIVSETENMMSYLSKTKAEDITPKFGFTAEQLKTLKASPEQIKAIQKAVNELYSAGVKRNPFSSLIKGIKDLFKSGEDDGDKSTEAKLAKIGEAAAESADMVGNMAGSLSDMFEAMGNNGAAEAMDTVQNVMGAISNIGEGFAKGGIIGGIAAAVGEAANFIGQAFAAEARHQAALKEIMNETISQQRAYNLLLMQQNLEYERATTIFGTDSYGKAKNAIKVMKDAVAALNEELEGTEEQKKNQSNSPFGFIGALFGIKDPKAALKKAYAGLADIEIKTGHEKTGLFGWGKGKDVYSSILEIYPELIDENDKFNASLAETIMNTRTMSDEDKAALQNMIDLSKQAEEALQAVKDYLTDIFGELGNTMSDALVDAFKNGTDAAQAFTDSVSDMLEKLAKEMIYSALFSDMISKAQDSMLDIMQNDDLSEEQKFNNYVSILDGLTSDVLGQQDTYNALMKKYKEMAAEKGVDIFKPDEEERKASSKAGITASQDSVDEMSGRITTIQGHTYTINENVKVLVSVSSQALEKLTSIDRNTKDLCDKTDKVIEQNDSIKREVSNINTKGVTIKK
jgi:tape measure domain-containing protein|nr:MAG TPA_asm: tail tape measure protein [Caudoviricetes sp.]